MLLFSFKLFIKVVAAILGSGTMMYQNIDADTVNKVDNSQIPPIEIENHRIDLKDSNKIFVLYEQSKDSVNVPLKNQEKENDLPTTINL